MKCIRCHQDIEFTTIFDRSDAYWPYHNWIAFGCPFCKSDNYVLLEEKTLPKRLIIPGENSTAPSAGVISIGYLDAFPEPTFVSVETMEVAGLVLNGDEEKVEIRLGSRRWVIKAKKRQSP